MLRFVVHNHFATHHHWDFRLELDGVLMSWAVPKEPPLKDGVKRLCILVDPHKLSYIDFEGEIADGTYGAGKVEIWDNGVYELESRKTEAGIDTKLVFLLHGRRLKGRYTLLKFEKAGPKEWLLFKTKEEQKVQ
jgi:DNA ligase D-like protein (predicted 3'-phosphoesterase)